MTPEEVKATLGDLRYMTLDQGRMLTWLIRLFRLKKLLEIGHLHGVSTCYLAAAAAPNGGCVVSIDVEQAYTPSVEDSLAKCGLTNVAIHRERILFGGEWRLLKLLDAGEAGTFDFCYIDSLHFWNCAAAQFVMVERLLAPGGWLVFDDLELDYSGASDNSPWVARMTEEERAVKQVGKVWEHLVLPHAGFCNFLRYGGWGLCQKVPARR